MSDEYIVTECLGGVALVTLNRPEKLNALSFGLVRELDEALTQGAALLTSTLDIRIGCEHTKFRFLAASYGRVNSTWSLPLLVGMPKAKELLYTGREVTAAEAERIGLLNQVVPAAQLRATAVQMAEMIAQNDTRMVQGIKRLLHEDIGMHWRERYDNEEEARATWLTSAHPREGFKDFLSRKGQRA